MMSNQEALNVKPGDRVKVHTLVAEVVGVIVEAGGDAFIITNYGNFNASVCEKVEEGK
jgi:hypothetical protein